VHKARLEASIIFVRAYWWTYFQNTSPRDDSTRNNGDCLI